jgi:carboxylesterase
MTCIFELLKLSRFVRKKELIQKVVTPILLIHSEEDDLTSPRSAKVVYSGISSEDKDLIILNDSYHMVLYDNEKEYVFNKAVEFLNAHSKQKECVPC